MRIGITLAPDWMDRLEKALSARPSAPIAPVSPPLPLGEALEDLDKDDSQAAARETKQSNEKAAQEPLPPYALRG